MGKSPRWVRNRDRLLKVYSNFQKIECFRVTIIFIYELRQSFLIILLLANEKTKTQHHG